jgi:hypothetical protein
VSRASSQNNSLSAERYENNILPLLQSVFRAKVPEEEALLL